MVSLQDNVDLFPHNTFRIHATARYFTTVSTVDKARELFASNIFKKERHLFLGGGSNILLTQDFPGIVIKNLIKGIHTVREDDANITLKVGAGENWHAFVMHCVDRDLGGLENLSLIPGTVGAAPMQNIGAYGVEVKDLIDQVEAVNISTGDVVVFSKEDCRFGYRESIFKQEARDQYFISSVTLTLTKKDHRFNITYGAIQETLQQSGHDRVSVKAISDAVILIRQSKLPDPAVIGNAGSFFKNPSIPADLYDFIKKSFPTVPHYPGDNGMIKVPAGWLIEQCGWKGKKIDAIGVHERQALVLVNYGGGKGENIWQLAMNIQQSVKEKFNIILHPEVNVI
jgi:UDP-N-acetylmuramate dehydrogenase